MTKEEAYDEHIAPLMARIIELSVEHGIAMLANFELDPNDQGGALQCTTHRPDGDGDFPEHHQRAMREISRRPSFMAFTITKAKPEA